MSNTSALITIEDFCKKYSWPTEGALRNYITQRKKLGLSRAIFKFGKRVVIDEEEFFRLVRENSK